jgi:hypothetical protein
MRVTILDAQGIAKGIADVATTAKAVQEDIHGLAVSCLAHVRDHGDTTLAVRLLGVLPSGQRRKTLAQWFKVYSTGKMLMALDPKHGTWSCKLKDRVPEDFKVDDAMDCDYGDLEPEQRAEKPKSLKDLVAAIARFTKNDKTVMVNGVLQPVVPAELVKAAQKALTAITA